MEPLPFDCSALLLRSIEKRLVRCQSKRLSERRKRSSKAPKCKLDVNSL
jgi:hypothetical protein